MASVLLLSSILCISLITGCINDAVLAQNAVVFACDVVKNPGLASLEFCDRSLDLRTRVNDLVKRLTLQEKVVLLVNSAGNVSRLGIPNYEWWSEALHGVAFPHNSKHFTCVVPGATSFPQVILTAASFNDSLFKSIGKVVSTEARAMYNLGLAGLTYWSPNVNIFRDPRWGRGQETPGEDPKLTSRYGSAYVRGLQETEHRDKNRLKVAACCKHYTAYDLDNWRSIDRFHFNAEVNKQDMEDTFQPPFKSCIMEGNVASIMCSYNQVNGKPTCGASDLLLEVIRGEWKLNGYINSDCDSLWTMFNDQHWTKTPEETAADALLAGLDLNCGDFLGEHAEGAVKAGLVKESEIDRAISNNVATLMRLGFFDGDPRNQIYGNLGPKDVCTQENRELAREAARQGIVLLKNNPGSLPFSPTSIRTLAVIGPNANATHTMLGDYQGIPCKFTTPLEGFRSFSSILYDPGCDGVACPSAHLDSAVTVAAQGDAVVLVMGIDQSVESEGRDRVDITLPGQQSLLVSEVAKASMGPVILVIMSGGGVDIQFAKDNPKITSILWVGYPGEAGGAAIADVIFGLHNPSGKLPMTWYPQSFVEKVPMTNMRMRPDPTTGYPGRTYRFYTGETVYNFGDGLSYSQIDHDLVESPKLISIPLEDGHVCLSRTCKSIDAIEDHQSCKNSGFDIHLRVRNSGVMSVRHTVLLFFSPPPVHNSPRKHLLGFEKVFLAPEEERLIKFRVDVCRDLSVVDEFGSRKIGLGAHILHVGDVKHSFIVSI